jgi:hypothetical protein
MSRREQDKTDDSATSGLSITDPLRDMYLGIQTYIFGDEEMKSVKPEVLLQRMLSTKTAISTDSSLAEANQRARDDSAQRVYKNIGKGQCGAIYALKGTAMVIKLPNSPDKSDALFTDFKIHSIIKNAFHNIPDAMRFGFNINIPEVKMWVDNKSDDFWREHGPLFEQDAVVPNYGLVSERVFPLPLPVRDAIVEALCPKDVQKRKVQFLSMAENKDCLVRLYLGRRTSRDDPKTTKLRNFPLHIDQMEHLNLDLDTYAKTIAQALAVLHWKAGVDANDVEFVLGSTPQISQQPSISELQLAQKDTAARLYIADFKHRTISVWLLDFNQCKTFPKNQTGLKQLVDGFWWNDPYYPRPNATNSEDKDLWNVFARHYLHTSAQFPESGGMEKAFLDAVTDVGKKRAGGSMFA